MEERAPSCGVPNPGQLKWKKVQQLLRQADQLPPPNRQLGNPRPAALSLWAAAKNRLDKVCRKGREKAMKTLSRSSLFAKGLVLFLAAVWHINIKPLWGYLCVLKCYSTIKEAIVQRFRPGKGGTPKGLAHWRYPTLCSSADEQRNLLL